jgi:hypothetical protein
MLNGGNKKKTIKKFTCEGHKYVIEQIENNYCVRKGKTYMCTKEVKALIKQLRGGFPVYLSKDDSEKNVKRIPYEERKEFLDNLIIIAPGDVEPYFPIIQDKTTGVEFTLNRILQQGSYGIAGLMTSKETTPRQFVLKMFFDTPGGILGRDRELNVIDRLNSENLLEESIYAKTITYTDKNSKKESKYVLMELGQNDLFSFLEKDYYKDLTHCDCIKIVYAIFKEVLYIFEKTGLLYSDIKLENFLYTHVPPNDTLHIVMADYGSLADYDVSFGEGVVTTYLKNTTGKASFRWKNNWDNVGFVLGVVILQLFAEYLEPLDIKDKLDKNLEYKTVEYTIRKLPEKGLKGYLKEKILLKSLTELHNKKPDDPDDLTRIKQAFKDYESATGCNLNNLPESSVTSLP